MTRWLMLIVLAAAGPAVAHNLAPGLLQIQAESAQDYRVLWRVDLRSPLASPAWPDDCTATDARHSVADRKRELQLHLHCPQGLGGRTLSVPGLGEAHGTVLLRYDNAAGREFRQLLDEEAPAATIPVRLDGQRLWGRYVQLGMEHILAGADHLLLVLALFLLAPGWRALLVNVTAFTLGHSLTLVAASLDALWLPAAAVELAIALSILWLALALWHGRRGHDHWPLFVAFGLVHGLGFAGALADLGLPADDRLPALLCFNLGIEAGQLLVLLALAGGRTLLRRVPATPLLPSLRWAGIYGIGAMAGFWTLQRAFVLL